MGGIESVRDRMRAMAPMAGTVGVHHIHLEVAVPIRDEGDAAPWIRLDSEGACLVGRNEGIWVDLARVITGHRGHGATSPEILTAR